MELAPDTAGRALGVAFDALLAAAERVGDDGVNTRPISPTTNSVAGLVVHCCAVTEFWFGHVALGRPTDRDRDAELTATATVEELRSMVAAAREQVARDLVAIDAGEGAGSPNGVYREFMASGDPTDAGLVLKVVEELFQHAGHAEVAADAVLAGG